MTEFLPLTYVIVIALSLVTPLLVFATYFSSGAGVGKSAAIGGGVAVWGAVMYVICTSLQFSPFVPGGPLGVSIFMVINLTWPVLLIVWRRDFFVGNGLDMRWLLVLHVFRLVGLVFLLEGLRGLLGSAFAVTAGVGDIMAATMAATLLLILLTGGKPTRAAYFLLIIFGITDFVIAFTLGAISSEGPIQLLAQGETHLVTLFPVGMVPFFLVPVAMSFHWLMIFTLAADRDSSARTNAAGSVQPAKNAQRA